MFQRTTRVQQILSTLTAGIVAVFVVMFVLTQTVSADTADGGGWQPFIEGTPIINGDFITIQPENDTETSIVFINESGIFNTIDIEFSRPVTVTANVGQLVVVSPQIIQFTNDPDYISQLDIDWGDWGEEENLQIFVHWQSMTGDQMTENATINLTRYEPVEMTNIGFYVSDYVMVGHDNLEFDYYIDPMASTYPIEHEINLINSDGEIVYGLEGMDDNINGGYSISTNYLQAGTYTATMKARNGFGWVYATPVTILAYEHPDLFISVESEASSGNFVELYNSHENVTAGNTDVGNDILIVITSTSQISNNFSLVSQRFAHIDVFGGDCGLANAVIWNCVQTGHWMVINLQWFKNGDTNVDNNIGINWEDDNGQAVYGTIHATPVPPIAPTFEIAGVGTSSLPADGQWHDAGPIVIYNSGPLTTTQITVYHDPESDIWCNDCTEILNGVVLTRELPTGTNYVHFSAQTSHFGEHGWVVQTDDDTVHHDWVGTGGMNLVLMDTDVDDVPLPWGVVTDVVSVGDRFVSFAVIPEFGNDAPMFPNGTMTITVEDGGNYRFRTYAGTTCEFIEGQHVCPATGVEQIGLTWLGNNSPKVTIEFQPEPEGEVVSSVMYLKARYDIFVPLAVVPKDQPDWDTTVDTITVIDVDGTKSAWISYWTSPIVPDGTAVQATLNCDGKPPEDLGEDNPWIGRYYYQVPISYTNGPCSVTVESDDWIETLAVNETIGWFTDCEGQPAAGQATSCWLTDYIGNPIFATLATQERFLIWEEGLGLVWFWPNQVSLNSGRWTTGNAPLNTTIGQPHGNPPLGIRLEMEGPQPAEEYQMAKFWQNGPQGRGRQALVQAQINNATPESDDLLWLGLMQQLSE